MALPKLIEPKLEARNPKYETNSNTRRTRRASAGAAGAPALRVTKILMFQTDSPLCNECHLDCLEHLSIRILDLFRISIFGFRI